MVLSYGGLAPLFDHLPSREKFMLGSCSLQFKALLDVYLSSFRGDIIVPPGVRHPLPSSLLRLARSVPHEAHVVLMCKLAHYKVVEGHLAQYGVHNIQHAEQTSCDLHSSQQYPLLWKSFQNIIYHYNKWYNDPCAFPDGVRRLEFKDDDHHAVARPDQYTVLYLSSVQVHDILQAQSRSHGSVRDE
eukprot:TRINITY_DN6164_c0_g1_i1.p1 TRINITY_DN6164_c0_g1~~TRINITY_DN6164_c0_g1_i1.p1  ORF type:complete len:187 (-),score=27.55 TRINITY_DN6164_c0_g1_i1:243-803(-)